jgi:prepilin-type N-terminal cleavage/methylation domain-containing protein
MRRKQKGFTLIELLVVIAIIGLLASVAMVSLSSARAKARDAKRKADFRQLSTALQLFYEINGRMPGNFGAGGACEKGNDSAAYFQSMQEMVDSRVLAKIPTSPGGTGNGSYCYYNYGGGNTIGAILVTRLESEGNSTTGAPPSCRPWAATVNNWCTAGSNNYYCICNPY